LTGWWEGRTGPGDTGSGGLDVRVAVEDVARVVPALDPGEPLVLGGGVGRADAVLVLRVGEEVDVAARAGCERAQRVPHGADPRPVRGELFGVVAGRLDVDHVVG